MNNLEKLLNGNSFSLNEKNQFKTIQFEKTELGLGKISTRTIKQAKIQETNTTSLVQCVFRENKDLKLKLIIGSQ